VIYGRAFFDLQLTFAEKVAALSGRPLAGTLLEHTNLYIRFALGREFDPAQPVWQRYLAGFQDAADARDWTYRFYLMRSGMPAGPPVVATSGCFSYARLGGERIRLHFHNAEVDGEAPLGKERREARRAELGTLFSHVRRTAPGSCRVVGRSWLYNLDAYRRLFPPAYIATARAVGGRFQHLPLWGQFLDRHGDVRSELARPFLDRLERLTSLDGLDHCFPFQVLTVESAAREFFDFYGC
jgi:hypothetical protein